MAIPGWSHRIRALSPTYDLTLALSKQDVHNKMDIRFSGKQSHRGAVRRAAFLVWKVTFSLEVEGGLCVFLA